MPERLVPFHSIENLRDLGGYPTEDGRTVRRGRLYRSDAPFGLSETALEEFITHDGPRVAELGIRTVVDLRRADELAGFGRLPDGLGFAFHNIDLDPVPWPMTDPAADEMPGYLSGQYLRLAEAGTDGANPIGRALTLLADERNAPLLFHCAAGKDRTGVLAALTLALLGVDDQDIADDYALSGLAKRRQQYWLSEATALGVPAPGWATNPAPPAAILLFLAGLRERYGSIELFAGKAGVTQDVLDALRGHLLS